MAHSLALLPRAAHVCAKQGAVMVVFIVYMYSYSVTITYMFVRLKEL